MGCTVAAASVQRLVEHVKNALQNIATEGTKHRVFLACHSAALPGYRSTRLPSVCCSAVRNKSLICTLGTDQSACACGSMFVVRASGYFIKLPALIILPPRPAKKSSVVIHSTADLQCIKCHVSQKTWDAPNHSIHTVLFFPGHGSHAQDKTPSFLPPSIASPLT